MFLIGVVDVSFIQANFEQELKDINNEISFLNKLLEFEHETEDIDRIMRRIQTLTAEKTAKALQKSEDLALALFKKAALITSCLGFR